MGDLAEPDVSLTDDLVGEARAAYFRRAGFAPDGGYGDAWVKLKIGPLRFGFPNSAMRVRAVKLHDIHHIVTGYATNWRGEAEIGAWEIASGCGRYAAAWLLNFGGMAIGLLIAPRRTFRAFVRGRHSGNLYGGEFDEALLTRRVGELRAELRVAPEATAAGAGDVVAFIAWSCVSALVSLLPYAAAVAAIAIAIFRLP